MHKWGRHDHARRSRCHCWTPTWEHWLGSIQILRRRSATGPSHRLKLWDGDAAASRPWRRAWVPRTGMYRVIWLGAGSLVAVPSLPGFRRESIVRDTAWLGCHGVPVIAPEV